jgi:CRISPR-associated protein Cas2
MKIYAVCYDVSNTKIRSRIAKILGEYGERVQFSVFEVALRSPQQLDTLRRELREAADEDTHIRFYRLCENCRQDSHDLQGNPVAQFPAVVIV